MTAKRTATITVTAIILALIAYIGYQETKRGYGF